MEKGVECEYEWPLKKLSEPSIEFKAKLPDQWTKNHFNLHCKFKIYNIRCIWSKQFLAHFIRNHFHCCKLLKIDKRILFQKYTQSKPPQFFCCFQVGLHLFFTSGVFGKTPFEHDKMCMSYINYFKVWHIFDFFQFRRNGSSKFSDFL